MSKVSEESPEEFLTCILRRLDELTSRGVKFHVDTIEGELPLEDLVILKIVYELAEKLNLGREVNLIPSLADPKNLVKLVL